MRKLIVVLILALIAGWYGCGKVDNTPIIVKPAEFSVDTIVSVPASSSHVINFESPGDKTLEVVLLETTGANIEFTVLQEGKEVYQSSISKNPSGIIKIAKGNTTIKIRNGNMLDGKMVKIQASTK